MTIFAIGMTSILGLLHSSISSSFLSRHEIVVANLQREEIELVKNNRNSNIRSFAQWDRLPRLDLPSQQDNLRDEIYIVENNYSHQFNTYDNNGAITNSPLSISLAHPSIWPQVNQFDQANLENKFNKTRLYLDTRGRYTHNVTATGTLFASYLIVKPLEFSSQGNTYKPETSSVPHKPQGYILDARVITKDNGTYREYDLKTVLTHWQR